MFAKKFHHYLIFILCCACSGEQAKAYEYSIKSAFCQDYARNRSSIYSSNFQYDLQVAYNSCMRNANTLIRNHEREKENQRQRQLENQRKWQIESEKRKQLELKQKSEEERRRKIYEEKLDALTDNADSLFR